MRLMAIKERLERVSAVWFIMCGLLMCSMMTTESAYALPRLYALATGVSPDGAGRVEPSTGTYSRNSEILITAVPNTCYQFDHWEGNLSGTTNPAHYRFDTRNSQVKVTAVFEQICDPSTADLSSGDFRIVGYFPEWGVYRQQPYLVKNIVTSGSANKLTVLNYAFGLPKPDLRGVVTCQLDDHWSAYQRTYSADDSVDGVADDPYQPLRGHFNQLKKLKAMYPNLKIVVSIGGWTGSTYFSDAVLTDVSRSAFVKSCIDLYIKGDLPLQNNAGGESVASGIFDGIDLDWEYPVSGGDVGTHHNIDDSSNFNLLLAEFRKQFNAIGRDDLLLTMAAPGSEYNSQDFHISDAYPYLDYIQLMTYDFSGDWNSTTGHLANLCKSSADPASAEWRLSMDKAVRVYRDRYGVPARKILPGAAFYGRGWTGVSNTDSGLYQSKSGPAPGTYEQGYELYRDLVPKLSSGYTIYWDNLAEAGWIYSSTDKIFWTFDEPNALSLKAQYIKYHDLGGIMFWEISGDNDQGLLLSTLYEGLRQEAPVADPCAGN